MPTGGGKSICYQIPALLKEGMTLVVSPLIALMNDQVESLKQLGVSAEAVHSNHDEEQSRAIFQKLSKGAITLLYVSPERLMSDSFLEYIKSFTVSLIAIDEAHCVSVWGNDFRPEYVKLGELKTHFPSATTIALTATADATTQQDISKQLQLETPQTFISSFERKNIHNKALPGQHRIDHIYQFLQNRKDQFGIIYCLSRKNTESVCAKLQARNFNAAAYHAGLDPQERTRIQRAFQDDEINIICATIAFGMGIDKANIRFVVHYNLPKNIEGYYQEIGRAGRDGLPSETLLFYSWADKVNLQKFIDESTASDTFKQVQSTKLDRMWQFASSPHCRTNTILNYFGEFREGPCGHCDNCLNPPETFDGTRQSQMVLSAIVRAKESIGINLLIDVLRGSYKQEVQSRGLDKIKTFGVGRDIDYLSWNHYVTQMINQGIIQLDVSDYSKLKLTPLSGQVLKGDKKIDLTAFQRAEKKLAKPKLTIDTEDLDNSLLGKLRQWRSSVAKKLSVPAYVVFHDKTLKQIASIQIKDKGDLLAVDGIGKVKLEKYGDELLAICLDE